MEHNLSDSDGADPKGSRLIKGRLGRAFGLGKVATKVASGYLLERLNRKSANPEQQFELLASSALKQAHHIVNTMGQMKGAAMKVGQLLSTDPELISKDFADALVRLQREAPPMSYSEIVEQVESAFDRPMRDVFVFFDPTPIGAASIGQVHRARLDDGLDVVVKIQYPGVADSIDSDLNNIRTMLKLARGIISPQRVDEIIKETAATMHEEVNYENECRNLVKFGSLKDLDPGLRIPRAVPESTKPTVLTMEYVEGTPFEEALSVLTLERKNQYAAQLVNFFVRGFHLHCEVHADPHPGNFLIDDNGKLVILDFGCVKAFDPNICDEILRICDDAWNDRFPSIVQRLKTLGFGEKGQQWPPDEVMASYLKALLAPLLLDEDFYFCDFEIAPTVRAYIRKHPEILKLTPPAHLVMYFRIVGGLKGILSRTATGVNLYQLAREMAKLRGI